MEMSSNDWGPVDPTVLEHELGSLGDVSRMEIVKDEDMTDGFSNEIPSGKRNRT